MLRYLALGDSYTFGEGIAPERRWPVQLADALRDGDIDLGEPHVIATTGWTTDELAAAIEAEAPLPSFDFVTIGIGVNDQYRGRPATDYRMGLQPLLETAVRLAGDRTDRVMMLSIPDWGVTRFAAESGRDRAAIAADIDAFNDTARALCEARRIAFVDITPASRKDGDAPQMLADDGLHPSSAMYTRWVDVALPVAHRLLAAA